MNTSLAPRVPEVTAPLAESSVPLAPGTTEREVVAPLLWPPGQVLDNRYRIGRLIQIGGMATVYEATQLDLVRRVAIKVPATECAADPACARRFEREARTLAKLQHPHIVSVFALGGSDEGVAYMAMELVEGPTLRAHLMAHGALRWRVAAEFGAQLADALEFAHTSGVVHGDVSASNVLLKRRGDTFVVKLIDFGAAHRIDEGDASHRTYGTRRYIAPELFGGQASSVASDLFALGAVLKEMLGEPAFDTSRQSLQQLIASMLDSDPQRRPKSAAEVALRLRATLTAQPAMARRSLTSRIAAGLVGGAAICVLVTYVHERVATLPRTGVAVTAQVAAKERVTALKVAAPPVRPRLSEPVAIRIAQRGPEAVAVQEPAQPTALAEPSPAPEPAPSKDMADRMGIIASLDRWLDASNQAVVGEPVAWTATRMDEPRIVFGPGDTCASVRYSKRLVSPRADGVEESIVEEQQFFAKVGESWQIIELSARSDPARAAVPPPTP